MDTPPLARHIAAALVLLTGACATPARNSPLLSVPPPGSPAAMAAADGGQPPYTQADVHFMQGMIAHHAQALVMSALAPTHGAAPDVRVLAERINVAQRDEIGFMQRWLRARGESAPDTTHVMMGHAMPGMLMPGMLTPPQLDSLRASSGDGFDRLFLRFMIQHHEGALTMVRDLFGSEGAAQDGDVFRFASDVDADQNTEIARMQTMLAARDQTSSTQSPSPR